MPNNRHTPSENFDSVTSLGLAVIYYLFQLHKQYPGILAQFAIQQDSPLPAPHNKIEGVPCVYSYSGRLFNEFSVDGTLFAFTPNLENSPEALTQPILDAVTQATLALHQKESTHDILAKLQHIITITSNLTLSLKENTWNNITPDELIHQKTNNSKPYLQDIIDLALTIDPIYTRENVEKVLSLRINMANRILPETWMSAIDGMLTKGYEDTPADASVQKKAHMAIAGALLFKLNGIMNNADQPMPNDLWKFISAIGRSTHATPTEIIEERFRSYKTTFEHTYKLLNEKTLREINDKPAIEFHLAELRKKLPRILNDKTFKAFHTTALEFLFETLSLYRQMATQNPEHLSTLNDIIMEFIATHKDQFEAHPRIIQCAQRLLESLQAEASPTSKLKHLKTTAKAASLKRDLTSASKDAPAKAAQQQANTAAEVRQFEESMKNMALKKIEKEEKFAQLVKRASKEVEDEAIAKRQARHTLQKRLSQTLTLDDAPENLPDEKRNRRDHLTRGLTSFKITLKRPKNSHDGSTALTQNKETSPRPERKKKHSPELPRKQTSPSTDDNSPPTPKHKTKKQRKFSDPKTLETPKYTAQAGTLFAQQPQRSEKPDVQKPDASTSKAHARHGKQ